MSHFEYSYHIIKNQQNISIEKLEESRPEHDVLFPNLSIDQDRQNITFDFTHHVIEVKVLTDSFITFAVNRTAIAMLISANSKPEFLSYECLSEYCSVGYLFPNQPLNQFLQQKNFLSVEDDLFEFTIGNLILTYYGSPINDIHSQYLFKIQAGDPDGLLIQRGLFGFTPNVCTPFLRTIEHHEININRELVDDVLKTSPYSLPDPFPVPEFLEEDEWNHDRVNFDDIFQQKIHQKGNLKKHQNKISDDELGKQYYRDYYPGMIHSEPVEHNNQELEYERVSNFYCFLFAFIGAFFILGLFDLFLI